MVGKPVQLVLRGEGSKNQDDALGKPVRIGVEVILEQEIMSGEGNGPVAGQGNETVIVFIRRIQLLANTVSKDEGLFPGSLLTLRQCRQDFLSNEVFHLPLMAVEIGLDPYEKGKQDQDPY